VVAGAAQQPGPGFCLNVTFSPWRVKLLCDQKKKQLEDLNYCREER
jgi:hypothetical protein